MKVVTPTATYRVLADYQRLYAGEDIDAAIVAFGEAVSRALIVGNHPDQIVRLRYDEHSVMTGEPLIEASIQLGARSKLAAVLYGVTWEEWQKRAPSSVRDMRH